MRKNMPKLMSIVLIFMLLAGAFTQSISPKPVSAAGTISVRTPEELWYALSTAESGTTVQLARDINYDWGKTIMVSSAVILDFNHFKITSDSTLFRTSPAGKLTLINAQIDSNGDYLIQNNYGELIINSTSDPGLVINGLFSDDNYGVITINSGDFTLYGQNVFGDNHGDININDVILNSPYLSYFFDWNHGNINVTGVNLVIDYGGFISRHFAGNVTITGGTIETGDSFINQSTGGTIKIENASITSQAYGIYALSDTNVILKNNTITSVDNVIFNPGNSVVNVFGGTYTTNYPSCSIYSPNVINTSGPVTLYGGTYTTECDGESALVQQQHIVIPTGYTATPVNWRKTTAPIVSITGPAIAVIEFIDNATTTQQIVPVGTNLKDVPGFASRYGGPDHFLAWKFGKVMLPVDTTEVVNSDLTLTAVYQTIEVSTFADLQTALTDKWPHIILGANIQEVPSTVVVDYDCTITSPIGSNYSLIRGAGFSGTLLEVATTIPCVAQTAPPAGPTLTLENVTVDGKKATVSALAPAVKVNQNTTLVLKGTTVKDNINGSTVVGTKYGGGIHNVGTLRMYEGSVISGNQAEKGGGVYNSSATVCAPVTFTMYGGEISGNVATDASPPGANNGGGGVNVDNDAVFKMHDGKIKGNSAPNSSAGGVSLGEGDIAYAFLSLYMYGGEITDNTAKNYGGGVYLGGDAMEMDGGLISRNTAAYGGGISAKPLVGKRNLLMVGGLITLNAAVSYEEGGITYGGYGGGVGPYVGSLDDVESKLDTVGIFDNLASLGGDDFLLGDNVATSLNNRIAPRGYGTSYASSVPLSAPMQTLVDAAKLTISAQLLEDEPAPTTPVNIPFYGWYYDETWNPSATVPRYLNISGNKFSLPYLKWGDIYDDWAPLVPDDAVKSIWYGLLLLYKANYPNGSGGQQYDPYAYLPFDSKYPLPAMQATILDSMFTPPTLVFLGWNTHADGLGDWYHPDDIMDMHASTILYAQWNNPTAVTSWGFSELYATPGALHVNWTTDNEREIVAFNLYRQSLLGEDWALVYQETAKDGGSDLGNTYEFIDTDVISGMSYTYKLEAITVEGPDSPQKNELISDPLTYLWWSYLPSIQH